jgi:hypothetical protein
VQLLTTMPAIQNTAELDKKESIKNGMCSRHVASRSRDLKVWHPVD